MKKFNYENRMYLKKLGDLPESNYGKYIDTILKYANDKKSVILDVGCGSGNVLKILKRKGIQNLYGVDISQLFVNKTKKLGLKHVYKYDGTNLPFPNFTFDIIGSFNVLEHTTNPHKYLKEEISKLKKNGYLIVACPNFLTPVLKTNHRRIHGFKNRFLNTLRTTVKILNGGNLTFEMIPPIVREEFEYDDDSIVVTNPIDLKKILLSNKCKIVEESGFINLSSGTSKIIDSLPFIKYFMPSCYVVARKK